MGSSKLPSKTAFIRGILFTVESDEDGVTEIVFKDFCLDVKCNLRREDQSIGITPHRLDLDRPVFYLNINQLIGRGKFRQKHNYNMAKMMLL